MSEALIVVPAFDEARTVAAVVAGARRHGPVLVVDDGSTDATAAEARRAGAEVLSLGRRRGKGAALRAGVEAARRRGAERVITLDGDGQHDPAEIPLLLAAVRRAPDAIVVGGRRTDGAAMPRGRWNACRVAGFFIDWITGAALRDSQSGFRSYPVRLFDEVAPRCGGFVLETELLVAAARRRRPIVEVDLTAAPRPVRPSRFHPLADGGAIGLYGAGGGVGLGAGEARAALGELAGLFDRARRQARHAEMAEAGARYPDAPHLYGLALAGIAARRAGARMLGWWRHPRRRRAALVLAAVAVGPLALAAALAQPLLGRLGADLVTPLVDRFYSQERLARAAAGGGARGEPAAVAAEP